LKDENERLRREIADLQARLGSPLAPVIPSTLPPSSPTVNSVLQPTLVIEEPKSPQAYVVKKGDSLYAISEKIYGDSSYVNAIYSANRDTLKSKNSLKVGQTLRLPPAR
jgi:nucleoid-associated protein YgaU